MNPKDVRCGMPAMKIQMSPFCLFDICSSTLQSKEIGLQMHEELLKVTNELYTVSLTLGSTTVWD